MAEFRGKLVTYDDLQVFRLHLLEFEMYQLGILLEYFRSDLIYILETVDALSILRELNFRKILTDSLKHYQDVVTQCGKTVFSEILVQDILDMGKEAVIGFLESLFALQSDYPHPNLLGVLDEISHKGQHLEQQITLDEKGHELTPELRSCQETHKQHLLEKTQDLLEHRAPGFNQFPQSFPISERYLDLIVVSSHHFRKRSQHEIIETGGIHEHYLQKIESKLERIAPNRLFRWCHRRKCEPQSVIVSGVPGVGKTTLMQKFVYDWVNGKLYQRFSFIFFFKYRTLNKLSETSLDMMILEEYPHLRSKMVDILREPDKLLFIFDGLDESTHQMDFNAINLCTDPHRLVSLSVIVVSLLRQSLLKGCSILMTSRPTKLASVDTDVFNRVSEIMGFFPKQREMYFNNYFGDPVISEKAFNYVRENGTLYTFCYIPSYCWIICTVLSMCFKANSEDGAEVILLPKTVTQLFVTYITNILSNHSQYTQDAQNMLTSAGWMAESGVMNHILVFDDKDLEAFHVSPSSQLFSSFMLEFIQPPNVTYTFLHLTMQEFLAALVYYLDSSSDNLSKCLAEAKNYEDSRCEMFLRFICGLSDTSTRSSIKKFFGGLSTDTSKEVIYWLKEFKRQDVTPQKDDDTKRKCLNSFAYLFESRNKALVLEIVGGNSTFDFSEFHLAPLDCTVLDFILESCNMVEVLDLDSCFIQTEGLERLKLNLHRIKDLCLCNNDLKDDDIESISHILVKPECNIQKLNLKKNSLTDYSCVYLAYAVSENKSLRHLDLSDNKLAGPDFQQLMVALSNPSCKIEYLSLQQNKLTHDYTEYVVLLKKNSNLTHLNLSYNFFSDRDYNPIKDLVLNATSLKELRLGVNDFSKQVEKELKEIQREGLKIII